MTRGRRHWDAFAAAARDEAPRAALLALVLGLGLGFCVYIGCNLSNAFPSEERPFGWEGASSFDNGVAMVRDELVLAASVPALLLGVRALRRLNPLFDGVPAFLGVIVTDAALLSLGALLAGGIGAWGASSTSSDAYWAFCTAHALLALAFYSAAVLCTSALRSWGAAPALGLWVLYVVLWENHVQWKLFRQVGYNGLLAGQFPTWFYVAQALSPLSLYRGILILWRPTFRDYLEQAALKNATLPPWMVPSTFITVMVAVWVVFPLALAACIWSIQNWRMWRPQERPMLGTRRPAPRPVGATGG